MSSQTAKQAKEDANDLGIDVVAWADKKRFVKGQNAFKLPFFGRVGLF
jgi:hypothetical protein